MGKIIEVQIKIFSGIDRDLGLKGYDPEKGIYLEINDGEKLSSVLKKLGLGDSKEYAFFKDTIRVSGRFKPADGDVLSCLRISGGGGGHLYFNISL